MSKFYTYEAWANTFKPIKNHLVKYDQLSFETYGEEFEFVTAQPNETIWTEVDGEDGTFIISGCHWVNRIQYYITENPWEDEMTEVPTWLYRNCDCIDTYNEYGDSDPNCPDCDEGTIDIPIDTVVDLKQIYGEKADIIG